MVLVQESKLIRKVEQYHFRPFVRSSSWQELKTPIREIIDTKSFNTIDRAYFSFYQIEAVLQRLLDYKECNENNIPEPLIKKAKSLTLDSIKKLNKYTQMNQLINEFEEWRKANDPT